MSTRAQRAEERAAEWRAQADSLILHSGVLLDALRQWLDDPEFVERTQPIAEWPRRKREKVLTAVRRVNEARASLGNLIADLLRTP